MSQQLTISEARSHMTLDEVFAEWSDFDESMLGALEAEALDDAERDREAEPAPEFLLVTRAREMGDEDAGY